MIEVTIPYTPRPLQREIHDNLRRWNLIVCHRRFGKTVLAVNQLIKDALICPRSSPRFAYLAPTYKQAKLIAWDYLKQFTSTIPRMYYNESELRADFPNGGRVQLFGCEDPDRLRGTYLDGCVLDEYALMPVGAFSEVIRPALSDRQGWAMFIGTPKGHNAFYDLYQTVKDSPHWFVRLYKASQTGIIPPEELEDARRHMSEELYQQEYECSWNAAIQGAYYGRLIAEMESEGRITRVPVEARVPVNTAWDLGMGDATAIVFWQQVGSEIRFVDYYEATGEGLPHYVKVLNDKGYVYDRHILPHDVEVRELGSGASRLETLLSLGVRAEVAPRLPLDDGIEAVRNLLSRVWIDETRCSQLVEALRNYRAEYDEKRGTPRSKPVHDWASHGADAVRYLAVSETSMTNIDYGAMRAPVVGIV